MKNYVHVFLLAGAAISLCLSLPALGAGGDPGKGKTVYQTNCVACHGPQGKGDGPAAAALKPPPTNFASAASKKKSDDALLTTIRNGKPGTGMVAWKGTLSDQQIHDVLAYIRQLR